MDKCTRAIPTVHEVEAELQRVQYQERYRRTLRSTLCILISVAAVIGLRIFHSLMQPLQLEYQNRQLQTEYRATALSMNAAFMSGIGVLLNLVFGYAADADLTAAILMGAGMCLAGSILYKKSI